VTGDVAVLDSLRAAILDGEFAAGQRLVEVDLCERFGCTRFAVRAAIPVLASEGLAAAGAAMREHIASVIEALRGLPPDQAERARAGAGRAARR
jgi:RecA/RadA recombinase